MADVKQPEHVPPSVGEFVRVVKGEFKGLLGHFQKLEGEYALIRTRDHKTAFPALVSVLLEHVRSSDHTGGR